ncbi:serine/threonine-protein kinase [Melittangium boletus]|uniref:Serine/threonine protein kinase n=1 Tax=Melittangium boletus DSM 14713 TaxID=1294270 RepID=A0A286NUZ8_9BACT|nr:serine/threonine-protein kinase [Melittangium boletus]ATB26865.1 serine/threonine protein kinase [Melittangium boletus DSM 14713]
MSIENYGKYQLLKRLAMGGMAQIYLAREEGDPQLLVIKRILPHLAENEEFVQMFLDEARIAARLDHPNIVQIFDLGSQDDSFFIAMEYIHGEDLRRIWKAAERGGQLIPVPLVCRILSEACAGLDHAHKQLDASGKPLNIVHRDISPQNILLTFEGRAKVVDFGIAKAADQATETRSGVLKGKYSYMSPEQAAGQRVDRRSDIFALGVVLYELLTGVRLFKRANDIITLQAVAECDITPPSQLNARVPKDLDPIVMKALARDPAHRYSEALQFQRALEGWLDAQPQPSSTAAVSAYMKDLYAARLAEEARLGDVLVEEEGMSPPGGSKASLRAAKSSVERSLAERSLGERPGDRAPADKATVDNTMAAPRQLEAAAPPSTRTPSRPSRSESRPNGLERKRTVDLRRNPSDAVLDAPSESLSETPLLRPSLPRQRAIPPPAAELSGMSETIEDVDQSEPSVAPEPRKSNRGVLVGVVALVLLGLVLGGLWALRSEPGPPVPVASVQKEPEPKPLPPPEPEPTPTPTPTPTSTPPPPAESIVARTEIPQPVPVRVTLSAKPGQASLTVDGQLHSKSTVVLSAMPGQELVVRVEAPRHRAISRKITVGEGPTQEESLELEPLPKERPEPRPSPPPVAAVETRKGTVRFAVTPWADVSCGGRNLGSTPLPDVSLVAGVYECRFSNPEKGTRTQRIEVKPNTHTRVVVKF